MRKTNDTTTLDGFFMTGEHDFFPKEVFGENLQSSLLRGPMKEVTVFQRENCASQKLCQLHRPNIWTKSLNLSLKFCLGLLSGKKLVIFFISAIADLWFNWRLSQSCECQPKGVALLSVKFLLPIVPHRGSRSHENSRENSFTFCHQTHLFFSLVRRGSFLDLVIMPFFECQNPLPCTFSAKENAVGPTCWQKWLTRHVVTFSRRKKVSKSHSPLSLTACMICSVPEIDPATRKSCSAHFSSKELPSKLTIAKACFL